MKLSTTIAMLAVCATAGELVGQAIPETAQATRVPLGYRRTPQHRVDPFRHALIPHWGFVISGGAIAENNSLNFSDLGALLFLNDNDSLQTVDALDALGLIPRGRGLGGSGQGEGGVYLGGPLGRRLAIGLSVQGRAYGGFSFDDNAIALLRDGSASQPQFSLGDSRGSGLTTVEAGVHALVRLGSASARGGMTVTLGIGGRYMRPLYYAQANSVLDNGGVVQLGGDTIAANIAVEAYQTPQFELNQASGMAADLMVRAEWPLSGFAVEAMVANLGSVSISGVERRTLNLEVETTRLDDLSDVLDTLELTVQDTMGVDIALPRIVRFSGSAWANRILQLDASATLRTNGDFAIPPSVDLGSTWRMVRSLPLRFGLVFGGHQGLGYTGGVGIEARNFILQVNAGSLGGFGRHAKGVFGRFDLGVFF